MQVELTGTPLHLKLKQLAQGNLFMSPAPRKLRETKAIYMVVSPDPRDSGSVNVVTLNDSGIDGDIKPPGRLEAWDAQEEIIQLRQTAPLQVAEIKGGSS